MGGSLRPAPEQCGAFGIRTLQPGDCRAAGRHRLALGLAGELHTLLQAVDRLVQTIGRLESEALFSRWQCAEALAQVRRIAAIVQEHAAVAVG